MIDIIVFTSPNCGACKRITKALNEAGADFTEINTSDNPQLASRFMVRSIPTCVITQNNDPTNILLYKVGYSTKILEQILATYFGKQ